MSLGISTARTPQIEVPTSAPRCGSRGSVPRSPQGGLAEVLDRILDKGMVVDVFAKVSLVGVEIVPSTPPSS